MLEFTLDVRSLASLSGAPIWSFTIVLIILLAEFTTIKGANFKRGAYECREVQIIFDLAIGVSIKSDVTQKSSVINEIMERVLNMSISNPKKVSLAIAAAGMMSGVADAARNEGVYNLMAGIRDDDARVRTEAWQSAGKVGAAAVEPLAEAMKDKDLEVARAAKRGLWKIVRHVGRPDATDEKTVVVGKLIELLGDNQPAPVRREVLWMLSEIGNRNAVESIAALLSNRELREDARMVLQRIPGRTALAALNAALKAAPDDFKLNIAQSLRQRGVEVPGLDCKKLIPTKKTNVKPL